MTHDELAEIDVFGAIDTHARRHDGRALVAIAIGSGDGIMKAATLVGNGDGLLATAGYDEVAGIVDINGILLGGVYII